ncbi:MAG: hypothetical protein ABMA25_05445 [Ilumatobacteraceae bacterium]
MHTDTIDHDSGTTPARLRTLHALRDLHRVNAAFSSATGVAMAAASGWVSRQLDLPRPFVVVLGSGLVGWAALLVLLAAQTAPRLVRLSALVAAGDAGWVVGTAALFVARRPTAIGAALALATAAVVAVFAVTGFWRVRSASSASTGGSAR